ncbi:MAG: ABC transporter ATP-binding protein [Rubripirellula sp.]
MTTVQLRSIEKTFGEQEVLRQLDFVAKSGSYVVLLGPSGCGKTTTLRMIAGLDSPDRGSIEFDGASVLRLEPRQRDVSMVFQQDGLYPHLTIEESIRFGMKRRLPATELQTRVNEAVRLAGIERLLDRYPNSLSGGELRRGAIAKAIVRRSAIRLLDEPLSALDVSVRYALQEDILQWHDSVPGTTIHVTHDGREAMRMADVIAVMAHGRIVQSGSPRDVYHDPRTIAVAKAIGSSPMNLMPAVIEEGRLRFASSELECASGLRFVAQDSPVLVGMRPESIQLDVSGTGRQEPSGISWSGTLEDVRPVESSLHLRVSVAQKSLVIVLNAASLRGLPSKGEAVSGFVPTEALRVFAERDGWRLDLVQ